jgi:hypothetical protein
VASEAISSSRAMAMACLAVPLEGPEADRGGDRQNGPWRQAMR